MNEAPAAEEGGEGEALPDGVHVRLGPSSPTGNLFLGSSAIKREQRAGVGRDSEGRVHVCAMGFRYGVGYARQCEITSQ